MHHGHSHDVFHHERHWFRLYLLRGHYARDWQGEGSQAAHVGCLARVLAHVCLGVTNISFICQGPTSNWEVGPSLLWASFSGFAIRRAVGHIEVI